MAFTPNLFLYSPTNVTLKDYQHAARVFTDDQFRLAPKSKFLYHVAFNINQAALKNIDLVQRHRNEINVLVKSVGLPSFKVTIDTLNQYNRKKNVQTTHKYDPIDIIFHDDNMGLINQVWQNYYTYYYADSSSSLNPGAYRRNATKNLNYITNNYGLDNGSTNPFFNYITIYQMARHEYVSYTLLNPIINSFNHNKLDSAGNTPHDFSMQIQYEAVAYGSGQVTQGDPEGFGLEHYDQTPSSLQAGDGSTKDSPTFTAGSSLDSSEILKTVSQQLNTYLNTKENQNAGTSQMLSSISNSPQTSAGLQGYKFPQKTTSTTTVTAKLNVSVSASITATNITTTTTG